MTTIRPATVDEVPALVRMGRRFWAESVYATRIAENPEQMAALATRLITTDMGTVLVVAQDEATLVGMIGLVLFPHHLSGERTAAEVFYWVEPEHRGCGVRLLRRAEAWAQAQGAVTLQMIAPTPEVAQLYQRLGYAAIEVAYAKELTACL